MEGPFGTFTLRESRTSPIVFLGGGAGMAPVLGLLRSMAERGVDREAVFYYGARGQRDLCFEEELRELESKIPGFRYVPALSEPAADDEWAGEVGLITDVLKRCEPDLSGRDAYVCGPPPMVDAAIPVLTALGVPEQNIFYDKFTTTGEQGEDSMTTTERPERSVPKPQFTDAEAGAREFPDSSAAARRYNYFKPAKRKQTHYEDVTVDVQPDPRHYLSQGWIYGFADGSRGYPLDWTKLKAWGVDKPEPAERPRHRQPARRRLARPRLARVPRPQRGVGA